MSQKKFVVAVIESHPQYVAEPHITLKECASIYYTMRDQRTGTKGEKIGYPNWLFNKNKVERGVYQLPVPTEAELSQYSKDSAPVAKVAKVKSAKVVKAKVAKAKAPAKKAVVAKESNMEINRLQNIINDSVEIDSDTEDFNQILRENGIQV
jgi:hypothetical protein